MKKLVCIVALLICAMFAFTGCNNTPVPGSIDRWESGETKTFNITMLQKTDEANSDYYDYPTAVGVQIKPTAIESGSFMKYEILSDKDGNWVFDVKMKVNETYPISVLPSDWKTTVKDSSIYTVSADGTSVTFVSTMESQSVFKYLTNGGAPISSNKTVKGIFVFYNSEKLGNIAYNDFTTTVSYAGAKATTTFVDRTDTVVGKDQKTIVDVGGGLVFDNESMLLAIRSLDMPVLKTAQTTTFKIYNAIEQATQNIAVSFGGDSFKFKETDTMEYIRLHAVPVGMGYPYFFYLEKTKTMKPLAPGDLIFKYELMQMNQGYMHFEA